MTENRKTPKLRFKGFTGAWEQRKLGDLAEIRRGLTYKPGDVKASGIRVLRSSNINEEYFEIYEDDVFVDEVAINIPYVKKGDIIITSANGSSRLVGKHAIIKNIQDNSMVHGGFMLVASADEPEFLNSSMSSPWYTKFINIYVAGGNGAIGNLSKNDLDNQEILVPSIAEQQKIGTYFRTIDNLITLHQRKLERLKNIKKSMLDKMFPKDGEVVPEIRFKGFTDAWEQRKLREIATMHARIGWQNLRTSEFLDSGDYMLITGTDFMDGVVIFDNCHYVERERYEQDKHIQIRNGSILITKDGTLGKVAYIQGLRMPATLNAGVFNVEIKNEKEVDNRYLFQYLKAPFLMDYVDKKATGGTIKHLNQNILVDFPVVLPQKAEQEKIGEYFFSIDNLITLHQRKLDKLKNIKKSMLDNMFV